MAGSSHVDFRFHATLEVGLHAALKDVADGTQDPELMLGLRLVVQLAI